VLKDSADAVCEMDIVKRAMGEDVQVKFVRDVKP
jgi:hypothetical protein